MSDGGGDSGGGDTGGGGKGSSDYNYGSGPTGGSSGGGYDTSQTGGNPFPDPIGGGGYDTSQTGGNPFPDPIGGGGSSPVGGGGWEWSSVTGNGNGNPFPTPIGDVQSSIPASALGSFDVPSYEQLVQQGAVANSAAPGTSPIGATPGGAADAGAVSAPTGIAAPVDMTSKKTEGAGNASAENTSLAKMLGIQNPLGTAIAAGGMAYNIMNGRQQTAATKTIADQAAMLNNNGKQLMSYLQNGDLPPGLKAQVDQATAAAKARVVQNFANQGMSTDPNSNSALAQQLQSIDQQALISIATMGQQLMQTGIQSSGMASDLYKTLSQIDQTQTNRIGQAIANMAAALSPTRGLTLNLGK